MPLDDRDLDYSPGLLLTVDEAAMRMSMEPYEVEDMIKNKTLPAVMEGGEPMIHVAQIDFYGDNEINKVIAMGGSNEEIDML